MAAIIVKLKKIIEIAFLILKADEDTINAMVAITVSFNAIVILLPTLYFTYIIENPLDFLLSVLSGSASSYAEDFKGSLSSELNIEIYPTDIAPMGEERFKALLAEGQKYIGRKYVWGGSNPSSGFDCSGYICWVYTKSGVKNIPRTTAQGLFNNHVVPISKDEAKAGDLIFFTKTYITTVSVTHVGIYLGNNVMLHCGDPCGYARTDSDYWTKKFYAYGRIKD